jgi:hypothetical protein
MTTLYIFLALQFCDLATTLVFLQHGVAEGNPLVAALIRVSAQPAVALLLVKAAACGLAVFAFRSRRTRLLAELCTGRPPFWRSLQLGLWSCVAAVSDAWLVLISPSLLRPALIVRHC